jgi:hypothetical protein
VGRTRRATAAAALASVALCLGLAAGAFGATPAFELTSLHAPTNVPLKESVNQVMTLRFHANVGKFLLEFSNEQTGEEGETKLLPFDASAEEVQAALEKFRHGEPKTAIGAGNVHVSGGYDASTETGTYAIEFTGALGGRFLGEAPLSLESEITEQEETKFEKLEEKAGGTREPEEPEGEAELTTAGYHDTVDYQLIADNRGAAPAGPSPASPITVVDKLPAGLTTVDMPSVVTRHGEAWHCKAPGGGKSEKEQREEEKRLHEQKLPEGAGLSEVECTLTGEVHPDGPAPTLPIEAYVDANALQGASSIENQARIEGGGAPPVSSTDTAPIGSAPASFGPQLFAAASTGEAGETDTQAGGHPYAATTSLFFTTVPRVNAEGATEAALSARPKDVAVKLPAGFYGNPQATLNGEGKPERCPQSVFTEGLPGGPVPGGSCPPSTQVGVVSVFLGEFVNQPETVAVYNLQPPAGVPAEFGFVYANVPVRLDAHVVHEAANGGEYRVSVLSADVNEAFDVFGVQLTLWGVPANPSHTAERFKNLSEKGAEPTGPETPFLTNPADCATEAQALEPGAADANLAPVTTAAIDSWEHPGALDAEGEPVVPGSNWSLATATSPRVTGCESLSFEPHFAFFPRPHAATEAQAEEQEVPLEEKEQQALANKEPVPERTTGPDEPSGYTFQLQIPQHETLGGLATPQLRNTSVTLPEGVSLSPSSANGLQACTASEIDLESLAPGNCPLASQVGKVTIVSQLLEKPLQGRVYVGEPQCSPCDAAQAQNGELLKLYIEVEGSGVRVKLPGSASVDQSSGRISTTFLNNPQLPFEKLTLRLKIGPRAPMVSAQECTTGLLAGATLTPWSLGATTPGGEVGGTPTPSPFAADGPFGFSGCPSALPFNPSFSAGTESSAAGHYTNFDVTFSRKDGEQDLSGVTVHTPPGLLGKIAGIPRCEGVAAESTSVECSPASQIGTATSAAGAGSEPYVVPGGRVYLTGPYRNGPFGLKVVVPAVAGPFNLGIVVVRSAITINPRTSAITVTSDPLPQSIDGIPFRLKTVKVDINRPEFMFNPTNCETQSVSASIAGLPVKAGEAGAVANASVPFTASSCAALSFAPTFTAETNARVTKLNGTSFRVTVHQKPGESAIRKVELQLPEGLPSRIETLQKSCPEKAFAENPASCPATAVIGSATAHSPVLSSALTGPAYIVSHGGAAFPDVVFLLQGEGVHIELVGNTFIKKLGSGTSQREVTFSKFEAVPDAPISSFETNFPAGPHGILTGYGNLCEEPLDAPTTITAQNGARFTQETKISVGECPPQLSILSAHINGGKLQVTLKISAAGVVAVSGSGLKAVRRSMRSGQSKLTLALTRSGKKLAKHHKKLKLTATLTAEKQTTTKSASVKS